MVEAGALNQATVRVRRTRIILQRATPAISPAANQGLSENRVLRRSQRGICLASAERTNVNSRGCGNHGTGIRKGIATLQERTIASLQ